jgi:hypothetical protein
MSTAPPSRPNNYWPDVSKEVGTNTQFALKILQTATQQHDQAFTELKTQVDALAPSGSTTPTVKPVTQAQLAAVQADVSSKAPIASPVFTGAVTQPEPPVLTAAITTTTATAGAATALPATPEGYLTIRINGTDYKVPYFVL